MRTIRPRPELVTPASVGLPEGHAVHVGYYRHRDGTEGNVYVVARSPYFASRDDPWLVALKPEVTNTVTVAGVTTTVATAGVMRRVRFIDLVGIPQPRGTVTTTYRGAYRG